MRAIVLPGHSKGIHHFGQLVYNVIFIALYYKEGKAIKAIDILPWVKLLNIDLPIPGYNRFIGSYLLAGEKAAVVDPGPAIALPGLMAGLEAAGINPAQVSHIILTHIHIDHAGCAGELAGLLPQARVIAHSRAVKHLAEPSALWEGSLKTLGDLALLYGGIKPVPRERIIAANEGDLIDLGQGKSLEIYLTPGHAPHHISLFNRKDKLLLAGEAGGVCSDGSIRPATPPPFKMEEWLASIDRLIALNPQYICYGHVGCYDNAVERLKLARTQLINWHRIANEEKDRGKTPQQILDVLKDQDSQLEYLNRLDEHRVKREMVLLLNSVRGLTGIA